MVLDLTPAQEAVCQRLTVRQRRIYLLIVIDGLTRAQIAARLDLTERTIQTERSHIREVIRTQEETARILENQKDGKARFGVTVQKGQEAFWRSDETLRGALERMREKARRKRQL